MRGIVAALLALATVAYSHGNHDQDTSVETDWATRHMKGMSVVLCLSHFHLEYFILLDV